MEYEELKQESAENIFEEMVEGTPDIPIPKEVNDDDILKEKEEFAKYIKEKYETPGI